MTIFVLSINNKVQDTVFTGLLTLCNHYNLKYNTASKYKGKLPWVVGDQTYYVSVTELQRITGRDKNWGKKKREAFTPKDEY